MQFISILMLFGLLAVAIPIIINDAIKGQGFFMSTATYRDYIQQGK